MPIGSIEKGLAGRRGTPWTAWPDIHRCYGLPRSLLRVQDVGHGRPCSNPLIRKQKTLQHSSGPVSRRRSDAVVRQLPAPGVHSPLFLLSDAVSAGQFASPNTGRNLLGQCIKKVSILLIRHAQRARAGQYRSGRPRSSVPSSRVSYALVHPSSCICPWARASRTSRPPPVCPSPRV